MWRTALSKVLKRSFSGVAAMFAFIHFPSSDVRLRLGWIWCGMSGTTGMNGRFCVPESLTWGSAVPVDQAVASEEMWDVFRGDSLENASVFSVDCMSVSSLWGADYKHKHNVVGEKANISNVKPRTTESVVSSGYLEGEYTFRHFQSAA